VKGIFYPVTAASVSALRQDIYSYTGLGQVCLHVESVEGNTLLQYSIEEVFPPRDYPSNSAGIVHRFYCAWWAACLHAFEPFFASCHHSFPPACSPTSPV